MKQSKKQKDSAKEKKAVVLSVLDISGKEVEKLELSPRIFDGKVSTASIYRAVHNYLANRRQGSASTKTRSDVSGGGKKPWRQKGTGRARVGSTRNPLWRHGGVVFGPHPRDFSYSLPKKIKQSSLRSIINNRALENNIIVLNSLVLSDCKTKTFVNILKKLKIKDGSLVVINSMDDNIRLATRNIPNVQLRDAKSVNTYDILSFEKMLITKDALRILTERVK
ncbi:MAG: 50S ribosomal protein L4 [Candidatus Omnitrophica bacterium]|nr:50S ribosomal protein L4 [Candidatus Omnitrophota bacterium]MDD5355153.1 50S ribosomal protein L4 [Candidatus Omnitrophota bacterium]